MRILVPQKSDLASTGSGSLSYVYSAWSSSSVNYARDTKIRYQVGGVYYDYRSRSSHTSRADRAPTNGDYWTKLGVSATTSGATYTTNVLLSDYDTWTASAEVKAGAIKFDPADHRDYLAPNLIASGYNTIRPSEAVLSDDEAIAARWSVVSNANAWAPFDLEVYTRLSSYNSSNALVDPVTLTFTCPTNDTANAVILAGLSNVEDLTAVVSYGGQVKETLTADLEPSGTHYGATATSVILDLATPIPAGTAVSVALTLNAYNTAKPSLLGVATLAREYALAETEWGVETRLLSFSRKQRDETFGTTTFLKRGSATLCSATCYYDPAVIAGDVIQQVLANFDGQPLLLDFNNTGTDYDRLRIFGFYTNVRTLIHGLSWESLVMDVESLVQ